MNITNTEAFNNENNLKNSYPDLTKNNWTINVYDNKNVTVSGWVIQLSWFDHLAKTSKYKMVFFQSFPFHRADTVPVVMSPPRAIYEQVVPEGSFIHVDDFATPRDLGRHLNTIYENDAVFNKYLSWKGTGQFVKTWYVELLIQHHQYFRK